MTTKSIADNISKRNGMVGTKIGLWAIVGVREGFFFFTMKKKFWCQCRCGHQEWLSMSQLRGGSPIDHECLEGVVLTTLPEYGSWRSMKARCSNPNHIGYKYYGGRGIKVCKRWQNSFQTFLADMGSKPSPEHSIERIDNDGDYEPTNCKWATYIEQAANKRKKCLRGV